MAADQMLHETRKPQHIQMAVFDMLYSAMNIILSLISISKLNLFDVCSASRQTTLYGSSCD